MYQYGGFSNGYILVTHKTRPFRARFRAADAAEASQIVCGLNLPEMLQRLAAHRYEIETQGIEVGGLKVKTDRESQAQLNSTYTSLSAGFVSSTRWKGSDSWESVDLDTIAPIAQAVAVHVDSCFKTEESIEIMLRAITDHSEMTSFSPEDAFDAALASTS